VSAPTHRPRPPSKGRPPARPQQGRPSSGRSPEKPARPQSDPTKRVEVSLPADVVREILQAGGETRGREALKHADRAVQLIADREPERAILEAQRAKDLTSRSAALREILALAYYGAGDWRSALREMQAYRRMSARLDENHIIADCYRALGKPDRAAEEADAAMGADVDAEVKAEAAVVGAAALADLGRLDQALAFLRRLPERTSVGHGFDLRVWYVTGDILARLGRNEEAAREFLRIVRYDPSAFDAADRLAALA
jgi:tetratricopeptide (TPR) repeat protein